MNNTASVPKLSALDVAFGNIDHMPKYQDVPDQFKERENPYVRVASRWFFSGLAVGTLKAKPGVNQGEALAALQAIMGSFEPKHEHKIAGVAFLMSEWFDIVEKDEDNG